jgi:hypothetical protein
VKPSQMIPSLGVLPEFSVSVIDATGFAFTVMLVLVVAEQAVVELVTVTV